MCWLPTSGVPNYVEIKLYDRTPTMLCRQHTDCASDSINLAAYDGTDDFGGTSGGAIYQGDSSTGTDLQVYDHSDQAMLDYFTGDSVQLQYFRATYSGQGSNCGSTHYGLLAKALGHVQVTLIGH